MLEKGYTEEKAENRKMLQIILSSILFGYRRGLALRGRYKAGETDEARGECDSNFLQLLKIRAEDNPSLLNCMDEAVAIKIHKSRCAERGAQYYGINDIEKDCK